MDLACGTGHLLADLTAAGHDACGLDRSPLLLWQARAYLTQQGIGAPLLLGDATRLPIRDGSFTTVVMTFSGLSLDPRALAEARRVLAPAGRLVILGQVRLEAQNLRTRWSRTVLGLVTVTPEYPIIPRLEQAGFHATLQEVAVQNNVAVVAVARPS